MSLTKNSKPKFVENKECKVYILDLPESILNCILECLLPVDLCSVSKVCTSLRHRCRSDDLWERHIKQKWGSLLGDAAHREWQWHVTTIVNKKNPLLQLNGEGLLGSFSGSWPLSSLGSYLENPGDLTSLLLSNCSMMALYISLQNGRFRFPAQVYRKWQHGRLYDALLSYDYITNTFRARSPTDGWQVIEESVGWERLRASPIEAHPYALYTSQCWKDLKPGDHIEIQRKSLMHEPYDWHYGVIGHLESCNKDEENRCGCEDSDALIVIMSHYEGGCGCGWRRATLKRNVGGEQCSDYWLYGRIRKLDTEEDIQRWNTVCLELCCSIPTHFQDFQDFEEVDHHILFF